jgi:hypothetical protein
VRDRAAYQKANASGMAEPHVNATAPEGAEGKAEPGRSIIVKGASLEEAVSQGVFLLNAPRDQVTYEVLQEGSAGRNGRLAVPYSSASVSAAPSRTPRPAAPPWARPVPQDGARSGHGGISPQDLESLSSPAFLALLERVAERTRAAIAAAGTGDGRAGSDPANAAFDAAAALDSEVVVEVAPNHMEAYLTVTPAFGGGREADAADVRGALAAHGVRYGIDEAALAEAIAGKRAARLRVALGLAPQAGAAAAIRYVYPGGACAEAPSNAFEVAPGTVVAVKTGPGEGAPGMSVLGEVLPAHRGQDLSLLRHKGKNLSVSPDGRALVATASGRVSATADGKIHVESTLVLDRDVTPAVDGNLHFGGDILIRGSVARGVSVTAGGSVTITGNVDVAVVQAGGDVTIEGGVHGRASALCGPKAPSAAGFWRPRAFRRAATCRSRSTCGTARSAPTGASPSADRWSAARSTACAGSGCATPARRRARPQRWPPAPGSVPAKRSSGCGSDARRSPSAKRI